MTDAAPAPGTYAVMGDDGAWHPVEAQDPPRPFPDGYWEITNRATGISVWTDDDGATVECSDPELLASWEAAQTEGDVSAFARAARFLDETSPDNSINETVGNIPGDAIEVLGSTEVG